MLPLMPLNATPGPGSLTNGVKQAGILRCTNAAVSWQALKGLASNTLSPALAPLVTSEVIANHCHPSSTCALSIQAADDVATQPIKEQPLASYLDAKLVKDCIFKSHPKAQGLVSCGIAGAGEGIQLKGCEHMRGPSVLQLPAAEVSLNSTFKSRPEHV